MTNTTKHTKSYTPNDALKSLIDSTDAREYRACRTYLQLCTFRGDDSRSKYETPQADTDFLRFCEIKQFKEADEVAKEFLIGFLKNKANGISESRELGNTSYNSLIEEAEKMLKNISHRTYLHKPLDSVYSTIDLFSSLPAIVDDAIQNTANKYTGNVGGSFYWALTAPARAVLAPERMIKHLSSYQERNNTSGNNFISNAAINVAKFIPYVSKSIYYFLPALKSVASIGVSTAFKATYDGFRMMVSSKQGSRPQSQKPKTSRPRDLKTTPNALTFVDSPEAIKKNTYELPDYIMPVEITASEVEPATNAETGRFWLRSGRRSDTQPIKTNPKYTADELRDLIFYLEGQRHYPGRDTGPNLDIKLTANSVTQKFKIEKKNIGRCIMQLKEAMGAEYDAIYYPKHRPLDQKDIIQIPNNLNPNVFECFCTCEKNKPLQFTHPTSYSSRYIQNKIDLEFYKFLLHQLNVISEDKKASKEASKEASKTPDDPIDKDKIHKIILPSMKDDKKVEIYIKDCDIADFKKKIESNIDPLDKDFIAEEIKSKEFLKEFKEQQETLKTTELFEEQAKTRGDLTKQDFEKSMLESIGPKPPNKKRGTSNWADAHRLRKTHFSSYSEFSVR